MNKELLKILACPVCKSDLKKRKGKLVCVKCDEDYEIKDDIPILLIGD